MSNRINSSICLTDLADKYRAGHSAFTKANNGKVYVNLTTWINDTADNYGNNVSHQLNSKADKREEEGKVYVGNGKTADSQPVTVVNTPTVEDGNDLPF
jgi:hypothetical protein